MPAFDDVPRTHGAAYRLTLLAAVAHLAAALEVVGADAHPLLARALDEDGAPDLDPSEVPAWWMRALTGYERAFDDPPPVARLAAAVGHAGRIAMAVLLLPEEDARYVDALAPLDDQGTGRPPWGAVAAVALAGQPGDGDVRDLAGRLAGAGWVQVGGEEVPLPLRRPVVAPSVADALRGEPSPALPAWAELRQSTAPDLLDGLPRDYREALARAAAGTAVVAVRGSALAGHLEHLAAAAGTRALLVDGAAHAGARDAEVLGPLCTALGAVPVVHRTAGPGESVPPPRITGRDGLVLVAVIGEGAVEGVATLDVPRLDVTARTACWRRAVGDDGDVEVLGRSLRLPCGAIAEVAPAARELAALAGRDRVELVDVRAAAAALHRRALEPLAAALPPADGLDDVVTGPATADALIAAATRIRLRDDVAAAVGGPVLGAAGVRILLRGPSGTGKSLAARALAAETGLEAYRVDLAAVVDKYIGETEKRLSQLLGAAEELDVLLLLDEGDALLGARTAVRSSTDRYANLETNYLLQRLESYAGVLVVTTNLPRNVDLAFARRMDVVVPFTRPGARERRGIWERHLSEGADVAEVDLDALGTRHALTGGQIRNAVLSALSGALADDVPLDGQRLHEAATAEHHRGGGAAGSPERPTRTTPLTRLAERLS